MVAQRHNQTEVLAFDPEPDSWAKYPGPYGAGLVLKPDACLKLGTREYEFSWFIEQDMATEAAVTIRAKGQRYFDCYRTGSVQAERGVFPRTVWIAPDTARAEVIKGALQRLPSEAHKLFVVTTAAEAIAQLTTGAAREHARHLLRRL